MSWGKLLKSFVVLVLVATVLPLSGSVASAAPERRIYEKKVSLTRSISGYPQSSDPGLQLRRADVVVRYYDSGSVAIDADVVLKGTSQGAQIEVGLGVLAGNDCRVDRSHLATRKTWHVDGTTYWLWNSDLPATTKWTCALVLIHSGDPQDPDDVMVGRLTDRYIQPKLALSRPQLLGKSQKQLKLVRGVAQNHHVIVRNTGGYRARNVVLTARGKGMKTVRKKVGTIAAGKSTEVRVPLKLTSKKRTKVRITVAGSGVTSARTVKVRPAKAPARPKAGTWRSADKTFTFTVKNGRITKFRGVNLRMECRGGTYDYTTYRNVNLSFPKVKVPRHGYVDASKRYRKDIAWYNASLSGRFVGTKMTRAKFTYFTAGNCSVVERFTAKRR